MTLKECQKEFLAHYAPAIIKEHGYSRATMSYEWGIYIDSLCKEGRITLRQYQNFPGIAEVKKPRVIWG